MRKRSLVLLLGLPFYTMGWAGGIENIVPENHVFITVGSGYSWSQSADISVDTSVWDASPQGYDNNVSNSLILDAEAGYIINSLLSVGAGLSYRGDYQYSQFQTSTASATPGFIGDKTRFFDLNNTAVMGNLYLNKFGAHHYLDYHFTHAINIFPFAGAGVGVGYNNMTNFHSEVPTTGSVGVASVMPDNTEKSLAYQAMVGLVLEINSTLSFDGGYRYFNGGNFKSNNYIPNGTPPETAPAWTGNLSANEAFVEANLCF